MTSKANGTTRVQVTLQTSLVNEIDKLCEDAHMSRSAWIEYTLAMAVHSYSEMISSLAVGLLNEQP